MVKFFIERPIFAIALAVVVLLLGFLSILNLPLDQYPKISPPMVSISTSYTGANAEVVDDTIAQVIEQQVNGVDGIVSMSSSSTDAGSYTLHVQFETGKDPNIAAVQVQDRVSAAQNSLPTVVQAQSIASRNSSEDMALIFQLYSPHHTYNAEFLQNYGNNYMIDALKRVDGVGDVMGFSSNYSMRIWLQPDKMAKLGVSADDVITAIKKQNVDASTGSLGEAPGSEQQPFQYTTKIQGRLPDADHFKKIIIAAKPDGSVIHMEDIARVELGSQTYETTSKVDGNDSAGFSVMLNSSANSLQSINQIKKILAEDKKQFPPDMDYTIAVDNTRFIQASIMEVGKTFAEALILVMLIIFLFLQSWRATLIPVLAIPVSLVGTFASFVVFGFNINTITLFALILAIGLVVDDAIVVIEAVEYHMQQGLNAHDAAVQAMKEVSGAIVAIACVLASVFLPAAFFGGMTGLLYRQFALTIVVSMLLSAMVALSLTPALCANLLKCSTMNHKKFRFFSWFNQLTAVGTQKYEQCLKKVILKKKWWMFCLGGMCLACAVLYRVVPTTFIPSEDQGRYIVSMQLPDGSSLNRTIQAMDQLVEMIRKQPGVDTVMSINGMNMVGHSNDSNAGVAFVTLRPWAERMSSALSERAMAAKTTQDAAHLTEAKVQTFMPPGLPGLGNVGGFTLMIENRGGKSLDDLGKTADNFVAAAKKRPEIGNVSSNFRASVPGYEYEINRDKAKTLGVSINTIFSALEIFVGGEPVNNYTQFGQNYKVVAQADSPFRGDIDSLPLLYVKSQSGNMVPLSTLITAKKVYAPSVITRFNDMEAVQVSGTQAIGYSSGQAMQALEETARQTLPAGYTYEWSGQSKEEQSSSTRAPIILALALLFAFLCLAALYESWSVPLSVLLSVPSGIMGAFLFQYIWGQQNSIYMQIGLVMLIGLAAKNAILIVEFAKVRVDSGMDVIEAAITAAKLRLRPIVMTSLTFTIGCLPLMFSSGAGAGARASMGTAVVGGMLAATCIGIFLIPVLFVIIEEHSLHFHFWHKWKKQS